MTKFMLLFSFLFSFTAMAQEKSYVNMAGAVVQLAGEHMVVLDFKNEKKWHTYWKNPGDAGLPLSAEFSVENLKIDPTALEWPTPKKYMEQGNILAYGYEGNYQLFFKLNSEQVTSIQGKTLNILGKWLVCKDICIPGSEQIKIQLDKNSLGKTNDFQLTKLKISEAHDALPKKVEKPAALEISLVKTKEENRLALHYTFSGIELSNFQKSANLLTPFPTTPLDFKHEKLYYDPTHKTLYGRMYVDWDGEYQEPVMVLPPNGIFETPLTIEFLLQTNGKAQKVAIDFEQLALTGDESFDRVLANFQDLQKTGSNATSSSSSETSVILFILFAFIGGFILNLMPCVLPVISLKLFGVIAHRGEQKSTILKHNVAYTLGILLSFWVLAFVVLMLKNSGEQIGWGFQLQSPVFVFLMLIILLVMAMNMLGLFEFRTPGGRALGNIQVQDNYSGAFVSGVLATILSTPCSAPFLGTALTFAFTTSNFNIFLIFTFVSLGLAFPFILTGFFPKLVSFLPKPGAWMEKLKNILGFSLLLTFVWLYDVLVNLVNFELAGIYVNTFFAALFFAFFFRSKISKSLVWNAIIFVIPLLLIIPISNMKLLETSSSNASASASASGLTWQPWSEEKLAELAQQKKWVFMDFTASWCLTCKVNKKLVLNTSDFEELASENKLELLVGDWTKRDEHITKFLRSYNVVGVPAYFVQTPEGQIIHLGETISISEIEGALKNN